MKPIPSLLGAHMSISGGLEQAIIRAQSIECTALQIFTKNNRQWHAHQLTQEQIELFQQTWKASGLAPHAIIAHASYLINIGSSTAEIRQKSEQALAHELQRCNQLSIPYLVVHPGSSGQFTPEESLNEIIHSLNKILAHDKGSCMILLENMAGQGTSVCATFEQLDYVRSHVTDKARIGYCFDTCHAFAAGYDFRTPGRYNDLLSKLDSTVGIKHIKAIHLNDSKKNLGSNVDRHEEIGQGQLGIEPFALLMNDQSFKNIPKILETPRDTLADYARNLAILKGLILS